MNNEFSKSEFRGKRSVDRKDHHRDPKHKYEDGFKAKKEIRSKEEDDLGYDLSDPYAHLIDPKKIR